MGSSHNYGPFLVPLNIRCRIVIRTKKGTIILTTTHISPAKSRSIRRPGGPQSSLEVARELAHGGGPMLQCLYSLTLRLPGLIF